MRQGPLYPKGPSDKKAEAILAQAGVDWFIFGVIPEYASLADLGQTLSLHDLALLHRVRGARQALDQHHQKEARREAERRRTKGGG